MNTLYFGDNLEVLNNNWNKEGDKNERGRETLEN